MLSGWQEAVLKVFAEKTIADIRSRIPNVTGTMSQSLGYTIDNTGLIIFSTEKYFTVLETGRKPTDSNAPAGNPTLRQSILKWIENKPIYGDISKESLAYLISRKIHEEGTLLYRQGGKSGVISKSINDEIIQVELIDKLTDSFREAVVNEFINKV